MYLVFGSNKDGNNAGGSARYAHIELGAKIGVAEGLTGEAYALPTVGHGFRKMSLNEVKYYVGSFLIFAAENRDLEFQVTRVGCGIAGFTDEQIAPLFTLAPSNCLFDTAWKQFLPNARFWGTY